MKAVIGLMNREDELNGAVSALRAAGFDQSMIRVLANCHDLRENMDCSCRRSVFRDAAIGAAVIGGVYVVFGIAAAWGAVLNGAPVLWSIGAAVVFLMVGMAMGAFGGAFVGRAEAEKDTHLYVEGVRRGDAVLLVWADQQRMAQAMNILRHAGALGVSACTRARPMLPGLTPAGPQPA